MALTQGVGNLKCQSKFGNLLTDSPDEIMRHIEISRQKMITGTAKNIQNIQHGQPGTPGHPALLRVIPFSHYIPIKDMLGYWPERVG